MFPADVEDGIELPVAAEVRCAVLGVAHFRRARHAVVDNPGGAAAGGPHVVRGGTTSTQGENSEVSPVVSVAVTVITS